MAADMVERNPDGTTFPRSKLEICPEVQIAWPRSHRIQMQSGLRPRVVWRSPLRCGRVSHDCAGGSDEHPATACPRRVRTGFAPQCDDTRPHCCHATTRSQQDNRDQPPKSTRDGVVAPRTRRHRRNGWSACRSPRGGKTTGGSAWALAIPVPQRVQPGRWFGKDLYWICTGLRCSVLPKTAEKCPSLPALLELVRGAKVC